MAIGLIPQKKYEGIFSSDSYSPFLNPKLIAINGDYLYAIEFDKTSGNNNKLDILNISNPLSISFIKTFTLSEIPTGLSIFLSSIFTNNKLIIGALGVSSDVRFYVYNILSDPETPQIQYISDDLTSLSTNGISKIFTISNDSFYFTSLVSSDLTTTVYYVENISDNSKKSSLTISSESSYGGFSIYSIGNKTYIYALSYRDDNNMIDIIELDNNTAILTKKDSISIGDNLGIYIKTIDNYLYVYGQYNGTGPVITTIDISSPENIYIVSESYQNDENLFSSSLVILSNETSGILTTQIDNGATQFDNNIYMVNFGDQKRPKISYNSYSYPQRGSLMGGGSTPVIGISQYSDTIKDNYLYLSYANANAYYLLVDYLYSDTNTTTTTTTTPITIQTRENKLSSVQTILVSATGETIANDASNNKGTLNSITSEAISFDFVPAGAISETKIIYLKVSLAQAIGNIKIALINTGSIAFATNTFGIETRANLDYNIVPESYFIGLNTDDDPNNINNISIPNFKDNYSQYVYLNMKAQLNQPITDSKITLKWFFDYA